MLFLKREFIARPDALAIDESFWNAGLRGQDKLKPQKLWLCLLKDDRCVPRDAANTADLIATSDRAHAMLLRHERGFIRRAPIIAPGFTISELRHAVNLEWMRKKDIPEAFPNMPLKQIQAICEAVAIHNQEVRRLAMFWELLIDGYNRFEICRKHGLPYTTVGVDGIPDREHALLWIEENQLGRCNLPDDQRAALALRVADRRTALSLSERNKAAVEKRWHAEYEVIDADHHVSEKKPKKTRIRTEVAKQAAVSEKRIRAVAEIRKQSPDAYQRIARGESTIREEKGGAEQGAP